VWACRYIPAFRTDIAPSSFHGWRWRQYERSKCIFLPGSPHGVTTQQTNIDIIHNATRMFVTVFTTARLVSQSLDDSSPHTHSPLM
jgi:hypothetical protein